VRTAAAELLRLWITFKRLFLNGVVPMSSSVLQRASQRVPSPRRCRAHPLQEGSATTLRCAFFDITVRHLQRPRPGGSQRAAVSPRMIRNPSLAVLPASPPGRNNLLAMHGGRTFFFVNLAWNYPSTSSARHRGGHPAHPAGPFHRSSPIRDGSSGGSTRRRSARKGVSLVEEFRVYQTATASARLFATTSQTAPLPEAIHGVSWWGNCL